MTLGRVEEQKMDDEEFKNAWKALPNEREDLLLKHIKEHIAVYHKNPESSKRLAGYFILVKYTPTDNDNDQNTGWACGQHINPTDVIHVVLKGGR